MFVPSPLGAECLAEVLVVLLGHTEQVGDDQQRERLCVRREELALAVGDELIDVAVGQPPHEVLVLLEPLRASAAGERTERASV